ncbi:Alpha/Beta hydrolase protein [Filobasidium floriforme]|uniref:Alpha/Beta hydrolase protein n=1 Tax=Filobasidium floriforme TaxID=5210 RepID=UPI001E8CA8B1|nr:Alpha/Beta hydrolase protein [Filobasidium floriforme]KAH8085217.1 Alpha/Beta hydrolase protein [Filobasidium floriforme]
MLFSAGLIGLLLPLAAATIDGQVHQLHARQAIPSSPSGSNSTSNVTITPTQTVLTGDGANVTVQGVTIDSLNVTRYLGIPFAQPPVDDLRFAPPQAVSYNASTTINATVNGPACPQPPSTRYGNTSEDCLHLNVYTPSARALTALNQTATILAGNNTNLTSAYEDGLPVMVWIYGGGFTSGSTLPYDGSAIIAQSIASYSPVILVTLNYRVGIWGWPGGAEAAAAGASMLGLQDQLLALKWVRQNIQSFGGDPEKVTVFGESAGAISIGLHLINPELVAASNSSSASNATLPAGNSTTSAVNATGPQPVSVDTPLFHAAILQSGSPSSYPLSNSSVSRQAFYDGVVQLAGCGNSTEGSFECLRQVNQSVLLNASNTVLAQNPYAVAYGPSIDGRLVTGSPTELIAEGAYVHIPTIAGDVLDEGTIFVPPTISNETAFQGFVEAAFESSASIGVNQTVLDSITEYYTNGTGSPFRAPANETFGRSPYYKYIAAAFGDVIFQAPRRYLQTQITEQNGTTWSYLFTQNLNASSPTGVAHGSDVPYTFGAPSASPATYGAPAVQFSRQMVAYWINFATALNPNGNAASPVSQIVKRSLNLTDWPAYGVNGTVDMLQLEAANLTVIQDDYREEAISYILSIPEALGQ